MRHFNNKADKYWLPGALVLLTFILAATGYIPVLSGVLVTFFALALLFYRHLLEQDTGNALIPAWLILVVTGLAIALYRPEGFHFPLVFQTESLHDQGKAFTLRLNIAKTLAGYLALIVLLRVVVVPEKIYIRSLGAQLLTAFLFAVTILVAAWLILDLEFHLKPGHYILMFGLVNLLTTSVSEEAFMRLILQSQLIRFFSRYTGNDWIRKGIPLVITTTVFVATHGVGSTETALIYTLAGGLYGLIYSLTGNVFASIATHFTVNILHFSFLTYPL